MSIREATEGLQEVGQDEQPSFTFDVTNVGSSPASVTVTAWDESDWTEITTTVFPTNSPSVNSNVITLSPFIPTSTYVDKYIRIEIAFTVGGQPLEHYIRTVIRK